MTPALLPSFSVADTYNGARLEQRTAGLLHGPGGQGAPSTLNKLVMPHIPAVHSTPAQLK